MKRFVSMLLLLALLLGCLPVSVLADGGEGYFYFSAESKDTLLIAPVKISYEAGQTVREALLASKYSFVTNESSGFITAIEGVSGSYICCDDNASSNPLTELASSAQYVFFTEDADAVMTDGRAELMRVMADYLEEESDVQQAAEQAYRDACSKYPNIDSNTAISCANAITSAIQTYKEGQNTKHNVTFSGYTGSEYDIYAVSKYGKRINAENGALSLPDGAYTFYIYKGNKAVSGSLTVKGSTQTIEGLPAIPTDDWMNESAFKISTESGSMADATFEAAQLTLTHGTHTASATRPDTFDGWLYPYVELNSGVSGVTLSAIYKNASTGEEKTETLPFKSKSSPLYNVLDRSAKGNKVIFRASQTSGEYTLLEDLTLTLDRTLTLTSLRVTNAEGTPQVATDSFSPEKTAYTYKVLDTEKTLNICPTASVSGVTVTVNNAALNESGYASVDISNTPISVVLKAGDYTSTYTLTIEKGAARRVIVTLGKNVESFVLRNKNGEVLTPASVKESTKKYTYSLVTGEDYSYYATSGTYFHEEKHFTLNEGSNLLDNISVSLDKMPTLGTLQLSTSKDLTTGALKLDKTFASATHEYTATVADTDSQIYAGAAASTGSYENTPVCTAAYNIISKQAADGTAKTVELTEEGTQLSNVLLYQNANGNTVTFNVAYSTNVDATGSSTTYSTDYVVRIKRGLTLQSLEISGATLNFSGATKAYTITVPTAQSKLSLTATAWGNNRYTETDGGYVLSANGEEIESGKAAEIKLSGNSKEETVKVTVESRDEQSDVVSYTITVKKAAGSKVTFNVETSGALLYIYEMDGGNRVWPDANGVCEISTGFTYCYSVTKSGCQGKSGAFQLEDENLVFGQIVKDASDNYKPKFETDNTDKRPIKDAISFTLTAAPASTLTKLDAEWPDFRGDASNNGVISAKTPINAEDGTLYWASKIGENYTNAVSAPILVDGYLYVYAGKQLLKIDKDTGETAASGTMAGASSYAINSPTYADGVILVGLSNGRVQAFSAETLESLWLYTDPLGGQPNCPITVHNGFAYTGFWNGEEKDGAFVCLSLTDEDPEKTSEDKAPSWRYVQKGGFYWAGAYVCDDFVMVGTDDGKEGWTSATANLLLLDPETGRLLDSKTGIVGDIRSSICYDTETKAYSFTTKGGYFYKVTVTAADGTYTLGEPQKIALGGMSTSTPVAANGRAYVGVSGTKQFDGDGYKLAVIDLNSGTVAYTIPTNGYPQTSGLLTTAYSGYNYVYFIENTQPGTLRLLRDQSGQTAPDTTYQTKEGSAMSAYALFTPAGSQAQYCICSPIADENGTLYFKNDSGYLMAFGSAIKPDTLKVESHPKKLQYQAGEMFDKTGLKVTAQFTDGTTRDVTKLMEQEVSAALTEGTAAVTLKYAPKLTMYHNQQNTDKTMTPRVETNKPTVQIAITVGETSQKIDTIQWAYASNKLTLSGKFPTGAKLIAAAYDKTGKMTGTKVFTALGSAQITGAKIRLFLLDANGKPLCSSVTVTGA